jgi:hypothetical protein
MESDKNLMTVTEVVKSTFVEGSSVTVTGYLLIAHGRLPSEDATLYIFESLMVDHSENLSTIVYDHEFQTANFIVVNDERLMDTLSSSPLGARSLLQAQFLYVIPAIVNGKIRPSSWNPEFHELYDLTFITSLPNEHLRHNDSVTVEF